MLATVLEEMPPFPEKESSGLLNLLKKKRPGRVPENPDRLDTDVSKKESNGGSGLSLPDTQAQEGGRCVDDTEPKCKFIAIYVSQRGPAGTGGAQCRH